MKIRQLLTLLALLVSPVVGQTVAEPVNNQVQTGISASAPASLEAGDLQLLNKLKERVDPNYIAQLKDQTGHDKSPKVLS